MNKTRDTVLSSSSNVRNARCRRVPFPLVRCLYAYHVYCKCYAERKEKNSVAAFHFDDGGSDLLISHRFRSCIRALILESGGVPTHV